MNWIKCSETMPTTAGDGRKYLIITNNSNDYFIAEYLGIKYGFGDAQPGRNYKDAIRWSEIELPDLNEENKL